MEQLAIGSLVLARPPLLNYDNCQQQQPLAHHGFPIAVQSLPVADDTRLSCSRPRRPRVLWPGRLV